MNFLPLCTASVCPTNSGRMVERRDHVLSTFFWRERFNSSTRLSSRSSTYGPFFSERPIPPPSRLLKKAHLLRWCPRPHAQRTESTPRARPSGTASQLDLFEQPESPSP